MLAGSLHAVSGDGPSLAGKVDLIPAGADNLGGARSSQDRQFKRAGCDALLSP
jgi:hypothetical protein